jgi:catechol 2,3-dioxygenase-like lactoylglutathione lyase family enzyme
MHWDLQVLTLAVRDVERARDFYTVQLGFRLDTDYYPSPSFRVVQVTPPGSGTSIQFGVGLTDAPPGAARNNYLVVRDIVEAHDQLRAAGISAGRATSRPASTASGGTTPASSTSPTRTATHGGSRKSAPPARREHRRSIEYRNRYETSSWS